METTRTQRRRGTIILTALALAATSTGCYATGQKRHLAQGNVGCPSTRGKLVVLDTIGLLASAALLAAPAYTDDDLAVPAAGVGLTGVLISGISLISAAAADCDVPADYVDFAGDAKRCQRGDAAGCYAAALVADRHGLSDPTAAVAAATLFAKACEQGEPKACRLQGQRRRLAQPDEAVRYFQRACELGDAESCRAVGGRDSESEARSGTCFFAANGLAVTNNHVVEGGGTITVLDSQGRMHAASVERASADLDLATLAVPGATGITPLPIAGDATLGMHVFTIGFPFPSMLGFDPKFSEGSVSGLSGLGQRWLYQISVPVQPGNSGGPLVDDEGQVVGVIVAKLRADKVKAITGVDPENVNFAIKGTSLMTFLGPARAAPIDLPRRGNAAITRVSEAVCQVLVEAGPPRQDVSPSPR